MATRIYHVDKGGNLRTVTQGVGSSTTNGVELTIDLAKIATKEQALLAVQALEEYIVQNKWTPA